MIAESERRRSVANRKNNGSCLRSIWVGTTPCSPIGKHRSPGAHTMAKKTPKKSAKVAKKSAVRRAGTKGAKPRKAALKSPPRQGAKPKLLSGGNPQIAKAYGDAPVQAYIAAMPGWKGDVGRRLDALIERHRPRRVQGRQVEHPLLRHRRSGLVPRLPLHDQVHQGRILPRHVAASRPSRRVEAEGSALLPHPRGRPVRRSTIRRLGEASQPIARRTIVRGQWEVRA